MNIILIIGMLFLVPSNLAAQPVSERANPALERLRAGVWMERGGFDSSGSSGNDDGSSPVPVGEAAGWRQSNGFPGGMSTLIVPSVVQEVPAVFVPLPVPVEVEPAASIQSVQTEAFSQPTPCQDLRNKARRLRNAAAQCDTDVSNGAPSCNVDITFDSPSIPRSLSAQSARGHAGRFEAMANGGNESACAAFGGQGSVPDDNASRHRADEHYERLCAEGDHYACNARQIEELCFASSPVNNCVRDCLVTHDEACLLNSRTELARCRVISHFQCYPSCGKLMPTLPEGFCVNQFPGWSSFK